MAFYLSVLCPHPPPNNEKLVSPILKKLPARLASAHRCRQEEKHCMVPEFYGYGEEVGLEMRGGVYLEAGKTVHKKNR